MFDIGPGGEYFEGYSLPGYFFSPRVGEGGFFKSGPEGHSLLGGFFSPRRFFSSLGKENEVFSNLAPEERPFRGYFSSP